MAGAGIAFVIASSDPVAGASLVVLCLLLNWFGDSLDGTLARYRRTFTIFGSFYDKASDLLTWCAICMALGWRAYTHTGEALTIVLIDASAFALALRGYLKWLSHSEAEKLRWLLLPRRL